MNDFQIYLAIATSLIGLIVMISKELRAWMEYLDKRKSQLNSHINNKTEEK